MRKKKLQDKPYISTQKSGYSTLKVMARKRKKQFLITYEEYESLKARGCSECLTSIRPRTAGAILINKRGHFELSNLKNICGYCKMKIKAKDFNYITYCMAKIRNGWNKNPFALLTIEKSKNLDGTINCAKCKDKFIRKDINIDHLDPVVSLTEGFIDLNTFAKRMFCSTENLQVLCKSCHKIKTKFESGQRSLNKTYILSKKNKIVK